MPCKVTGPSHLLVVTVQVIEVPKRERLFSAWERGRSTSATSQEGNCVWGRVPSLCLLISSWQNGSLARSLYVLLYSKLHRGCCLHGSALPFGDVLTPWWPSSGWHRFLSASELLALPSCQPLLSCLAQGFGVALPLLYWGGEGLFYSSGLQELERVRSESFP